MIELEAFHALLLKSKDRRIGQQVLLEAFARTHPDQANSASLRENLMRTLTQLSDAGRIALPQHRRDWEYTATGARSIPLYVRKISQPRQVAEVATPDPAYWIPQLAQTFDVRRGDTRARLLALNAYLIAHPEALTRTIPYREMALDVYGDEKALDGAIRDGRLFGLFPIDQLGMCDPEPPLAREDFPFPARPMLVVENIHTYWSLLRWNEHSGVYASIAFGSGNMIRKSVKPLLEAKARSNASGIEYLGDLDPMGLVIAHGLDARMRDHCGANVEPAQVLYKMMIDSGKTRPLTPDKKQDASVAIGWLEGELRSSVQTLFESGKWVPQEALRLPRFNG